MALGTAASVTAGCGAGPTAWSAWAEREGGLAQGPPAPPVARACARLGIPAPRVRVLSCDRPCAFAWRDGTVFVTRGLLSLLDEDELAAVLAHEMGHLLGDEPNEPIAPVRALAGHGDVEERADARACQLLRRSGIPTGALARALTKVRDAPGTPPACREALTRRILLIGNPPHSPQVTADVAPDAAPDVAPDLPRH